MKVPENKALLMITYWFPPTKSSSLRSYYAYREFQKYFSSVKVITTKNRNLFPQEPLPIQEEDISAIPTFDFRTLQGLKTKGQTFNLEASRKTKTVRGVLKLLESFPFNLLLGEGGLIYIFGAFFKALRIIKNDKVTHLFTSYRPYSDHFVAFLLKLWKPKVVWVADFRDIHADPNKGDIYGKKFQHWCNRLILAQADLLTTVSEGLANYLKQYHQAVYVLRNGISSSQTIDYQPHKSAFFKISYTGSLYPGLQSTAILFKILAELLEKGSIEKSKIQLVYAGKDGDIWQDWVQAFRLQEICRNRGMVSFAAAKQIQRKSQLNLLLSWSSPSLKGILTGKLYEYLAAGNPILSIINGTKDEELETIFEKCQAGMVGYEDIKSEGAVREFLLGLYGEWERNGFVSKRMDFAELENHTWEKQMQQFMRFFLKTNQLAPDTAS